tara:strand:- start:5750 stop:10666 length:4917 start_codon:yes stop_codon:yes gene_type:complete
MAQNPNATNRVERLQVETTVGQYFFQDLYNRNVYFEDFDDRSSNYFRLEYDPSFTFTGGRNLIGIRGTSATMVPNTEVLVEVVDANGQLMKSQVYSIGDDLDTKAISIDVAPNTPAGECIVTIIGVASEAPNGAPIPAVWQGVPNFRWTRIFTCKPGASNKSPVLYSNSSRPVIKIQEIMKPFFLLEHNQELSGSTPANSWTGNPTSSYILSSDGFAKEIGSANTNTKVSYRKSGDKYFLTAQPQGSNFIDFGGFTEDMEGGIVIVRFPQNPRPASYRGYTSEHQPTTNPVFAPEEEGDGLFEDISYLHATSTVVTNSFVTGAYVTVVEEVISPFELRTSSPHTTIQGATSAQYQNFEHFEFGPSDFELMWAQTPISYSASPTGSNGEPLNTSYAWVTFNNLEPLTGDVTRIKCYMKNEQAPFDWVLASDNAVEANELLYRDDFQKYRAPVGNFTKYGVGANGTASLSTYWTASGVGTPLPSIGLYQQQTANENPPVQDCVVIGDNDQALQLDGTSYWLFEPQPGVTASFYRDQWYELSFKAVSQKTQIPSWTTIYDNAIEEPKISIYMTGSAFTDGGDDYGKFIGLIEDTAVKKKQVDFDYLRNQKEIGKKFVFQADGTEGGAPRFKIDSGVWYLWDISIKPWDRQGFTPGTWDVIFPTIKCNVAAYDSLDFKFEFYNDYGDISNYTAVVPHVPWKNELTATFTNVVTNTVNVTGPATFSGGFSASGPNIINGPTTFSTGPFIFSGSINTTGPQVFGGTSSFTGPVTFSSGFSASGPITVTGPITMSGPGLFGVSCTDEWIISGSVYLPCLPEASQSKLVNWDPVTGQLKVTSSHALLGGGGDPDQNLFETIQVTNSIGAGAAALGAQSSVVADNTTDTVTFLGGTNVTISTDAVNDRITFNVGSLGGITGIGDQDLFKTIAVAGQTDVVADSPTDTLTLVAGTGMAITTNAGTDTITITNSSPGAADQNLFETIAVTHSSAALGIAAQSNVVADSTTDTLSLVGGANVTLSSNATTDAVTWSVSGFCKTAYGTIGVDDGTTQTATTCNQAMKFQGAGGITTSFDGAGTTVISMSWGTIPPGAGFNYFSIIASTHSSQPAIAAVPANVVADMAQDTLTLVGGTNVTLSSQAGTDSITMSVNTAGGGGADNLGNHTATEDLKMGQNWITSSDAFGHVWHNNNGSNKFTDYGMVYRSADDIMIIQNKHSKDNQINIADGNDGIMIKPDAGSLTFGQPATPPSSQVNTTHGGQHVLANNDWKYYGLKYVDTNHILHYNEVTGEITYFRDTTSGGGGGNCSAHGALDKQDAGFIGVNPFYGMGVGNHHNSWYYIGCGTTIGPPLYNPATPTGIASPYKHYDGRNDDTCHFMVNGFSSMDCPDEAAHGGTDAGPYTQGYMYAAIFNKMADPMLAVGGDGNFDCLQAGAGHGIKIATSTIPRNVQLKTSPGVIKHSGMPNLGNAPARTCAEAQGSGANPGKNNVSLPTDCGLANAFYLSCFHNEIEPADLAYTSYYAGGIRKSHLAYKNQVIFETVSDKRLKENIGETVLGIDILKKIPVNDFEWKNHPVEEGGARVSGFIAQDVKPHFPDAVVGDEETHPEPEKAPMVMDYNAFIPLLVKSIQDQQEVIENLTKRIEELESK